MPTVATRPLRLGILSREFFDPALGRMGGFGFAARTAALAARDGGVEPVLLAGATRGPDGRTDATSAGVPVLFGSGRTLHDVRRWRALHLDALLTIDWHSSYLPPTRALPRTPVLVWVRDPRDATAWDAIATLRLPGGAATGPDGAALEPAGAPTDSGLALLSRRSARWRRPVRHLLTDEFLVPRFTGRFGFTPPTWQVLGTPVDVPVAPATPLADHPELPEPVRSGRPVVVFLGRLDPIKRPWVFEALAAAVPEVEFVALGRLHIDRGWAPTPGPNLHWLGHVEGPVKDALLASAVATVNTSIHEALPLSLLESLLHRTPVVACVDPDRLAERFGVAVPDVPGDGLAAVPGLAAAVRSLLADPDRRASLGAAGQAWVRQHHTREVFVRELHDLLDDVV